MVRKRIAGAQGAIVALVAIGLPGCFDFGSLKPSSNDAGNEAAVDAPENDAPTGRLTFVPKYWTREDAEMLTQGTGTVDIPGDHKKLWVVFTGDGDAAPQVRTYDGIPNTGKLPTLDTNQDQVVEGLDLEVVALAGGVQAVLWRMGDLDLKASATVYAVGERPLVIAAANTMKIAGVLNLQSFPFGLPEDIDPSEKRARGAGSRECADNADGAGSDGDVWETKWVGDGGGGASFATRGGLGGSRSAQEAMRSPPGRVAAAVPTRLRGGCQGGDGGNDANSEPGDYYRGWAGLGGGAVQLIALGSLTVSGVVSSGGAGGLRNVHRRGGGGGGSGGLVVLESPVLSLTGAIGAPGGGGGQGGKCLACGSETLTADGTSGFAGESLGGAPGGGAGATAGGHGSDGEGDPASGSDGDSEPETGSGGGGGGAGFVIIRTTGAPKRADFVDATFDPVVDQGDEDRFPFDLPVFETLELLP